MTTALSTVWLGEVAYQAALSLQEGLMSARQTDAIGDILLLLEHPHVYTLGRGASESFVLARPPDIPIYRVSRGGQVTYHGPGQLVAYPIVALQGRQRDVHGYLRALEQVLIDTLARWNIAGEQRAGLTGVWVGERKIASIGVGLRRWITRHGFALNVNPDLSYFDAIVPCGIAGCRMTSVACEGRPSVGVEMAAAAVVAAFGEVMGYREMRSVDPEQVWRLKAAAGGEAQMRGQA
jgi:lipoyl(octanoyl) transferase